VAAEVLGVTGLRETADVDVGADADVRLAAEAAIGDDVAVKAALSAAQFATKCLGREQPHVRAWDMLARVSRVVAQSSIGLAR